MKISQREARRLRKRVEQLEQERKYERAAWARSYPGGTNICNFVLGDDRISGMLEAAQRLTHPLVAVVVNDKLQLYALPA